MPAPEPAPVEEIILLIQPPVAFKLASTSAVAAGAPAAAAAAAGTGAQQLICHTYKVYLELSAAPLTAIIYRLMGCMLDCDQSEVPCLLKHCTFPLVSSACAYQLGRSS